MNTAVKLIVMFLGMILLLSLYFEFFVNRPMNVYLQYAAAAIMTLVTLFFLVYLVRQLIKILNP